MPFGDFHVGGYWNALTNDLGLKSGKGIPGDAFIVRVAGNTLLDGISTWNVGDIVLYGLDYWLRIDGSGGGGTIGAMQIVTGAGPTLVNNDTGLVIVNRTAPASATNLLLGGITDRVYPDTRLKIVDISTAIPLAGHNIIITPSGVGTTIQRQATAGIWSTASDTLSWMALQPITTLNMWIPD